MERNLRLYPLYQICRGSLFWLPVFFLYFAQVVPLDQVLRLEAIYYVGVVAFEVPSGYLSDRIGRRVTLLISAATTAAACVVFAATASMAAFAVAQVLLAAGMAFNSGTDTALLYDSLAALDRGGEIGAREARAESLGAAALAAAALIGGACAGWDLRAAYALSALAALAAWAVAWRMREPPRHSRALAPLGQLGAVVGHMRDLALRWLMAFAVGLTVISHVPYELLQPYVGFLLGGGGNGDGAGYALTPLATGGLVAATMGAAAVASAMAMRARRRFGVAPTLLGALALLALILAAMTLALHPAVLALLALRSVAGAVCRPVMRAVIHPRLDPSLRATYFSVQSLVGRLAFSGSLALASGVVGDGGTWADLAGVAGGFAIVAAVFVAVLAARARGCNFGPRESGA